MSSILRGLAPRVLVFAAAAAFSAAVAGVALAADNIGVTAAAQNKVEGVTGNQVTPLRVGSPVYQNQHVRTAPASTAQLLFKDQTSLSVGPSSDVTLDRFIYDPAANTGSVVLSATRGAFRFVSGTQQPHNYQVRTPVATIGVRGTVVDTVVTDHSTSVILGECCADIQVENCHPTNPDRPQQQHDGDCLFHLDVVGQGYTIFDDGRTDGPFNFDGAQTDGVKSTTFPLHVQKFAIEAHDTEDPAGSDQTERGDETALQDVGCVGEDCGCPDCGPGF